MAKWLENAIFYEIYPQSFNDTNGDGIGDFQGIIEKLDYIKKTGFNAIWMNPCFDSPFGDAGYDVRDYKKAAARYGTNDDLKRLFDECHKRGMHILLDLVPGHTSVEHEWFKKSMLPESNEYTDRYIWTSNIWEQPEGLNCIRGISDRDGSAAVNFFSSQPALNYGYAEPKYAYQQKPTDPGPMATRAAIKDVMKFWLDMGCDGFRVDMAGSLVKCDPEYKETIKLWQDITGYLKSEYPEAAMVSEWGEPQYSLQGGFDMTSYCTLVLRATTRCSEALSHSFQRGAKVLPQYLPSSTTAITKRQRQAADLSAFRQAITIWTDLQEAGMRTS